MGERGQDVVVVFVTVPSSEAGARLGEALVKSGHAACANIIEGVESIFHWKGRLERTPEALLILKTTHRCLGALIEQVERDHPYEVPEVLAVSVVEGSARYLEWVREQCGRDQTETGGQTRESGR